MKIKKTILIFGILSSLTLNANESIETSYPYFNLDAGLSGIGPVEPFGIISEPYTPYPMPNFGIGFRTQKHEIGFDLGVNVGSLLMNGQIKAYGKCLFYPKPNTTAQLYYGIGGSLGTCFILDHFTPFMSPELVLGREYLSSNGNKRFFQCDIAYPGVYFSKNRGSNIMPYPTVKLSWGFGF